jgi:hypothetical protein
MVVVEAAAAVAAVLVLMAVRASYVQRNMRNPLHAYLM